MGKSLHIPEEAVSQIVEMFQRHYPLGSIVMPSLRYGGKYEKKTNDGFMIFFEGYDSQNHYLVNRNSPYSLTWFLNLKNYGRCPECQLGDYIPIFDSYISIVSGYQPAQNYDEHKDYGGEFHVMWDEIPKIKEDFIVRGIFNIVASLPQSTYEYYRATTSRYFKDLWPISD